MNIAIFTNAYKPIIGGVERSIETFVGDLLDMGHRTYIVTLSVSGAEESEDSICRLPAIKEVGGTEFSAKLPIPSMLKDKLDSFAPEIVHSHHPFMLGDTAVRVARRRGLPIVFTHHTLYERYTYLFARESDALSRIAEAIATEYANLCDTVIAPTFSIKQMTRKRGVTVPIEVIPTGIDSDRYSSGDGRGFRESYSIPPNAFLAGYLGRVVEAKNMDFLSEAVIDFLSSNPDAWYLVVGDGESAEPLEKKFRDAGLRDQLVMAGSLTGSEVADAYAAMDIFPFASKTETQGIVLIEAFSAGVPVIALDAPGSRDIVQEGKNGRVLSEKTPPAEFARQIQVASEDEALMSRWSESARNRAKEFDHKLCAGKLSDCYRELVEQHAWAPQSEETQIWQKLQNRFSTEWDLFKQKLAVIAAGMAEENHR